MTLDEILSLLPSRSPEGIGAYRQTAYVAAHFRDALYTRPPKGIHAVVFIQGKSQEPHGMHELLTIGNARTGFVLIQAMAKVLAPTALGIRSAPLIVPLRLLELEYLSIQSPIVSKLKRRGELVFQR